MSSEKNERTPLDRAPTVLESHGDSFASNRAVSVIGTSLRFSEGPPEVSALEAQQFADRYAASSVLGEGGMGEVRLCKDARIGRDVAMKVIRGDRGSREEYRARFLREVRVQGQLEHPSIVPVYDLGVAGDGETYFTMRRVRGLTLADILDHLRLKDPAAIAQYSQRKLLSAFQSVCLAVEFAHSRGVIHRDLKPSNVMLGDFGEVYVLDWGIAKILNELDAPTSRAIVDSDQSLATQVGSFVGTLGYLSPEQFSGEDLDGRSDVFSLGAILFEILTLTPLFEGTPISVATSIAQPVDARCSARTPSIEVPPELEAICVKATKLDRANRFASARELHDAVGRYLDGDRDLERRRELAKKHLEVAEGEMAASPDKISASHRAKALGELGRALALDPTNDVALGDIVGLLLEPPKELPDEVRAEVKRSQTESQRGIGWTGMIAFPTGLLLTTPVFLKIGTSSTWYLTAIIVTMMFITTALCFLQTRRPSSKTSVLIMVAVSCAYFVMSRIYGPLVLMPQMAMATSMVYGMHPRRDIQLASMALLISAIALPIALEVIGVLPQSYRFDGGAMTIVPQACTFDRFTTLGFLVSTTLFMLFAGSMSIRRIRNALTAAEERVAIQAWQFRQLVPEGARGRVINKK